MDSHIVAGGKQIVGQYLGIIALFCRLWDLTLLLKFEQKKIISVFIRTVMKVACI